MFWIFWDPYSCFGFFTNVLFVLTPIIFVYQLKSGVLKEERVSIFGLLGIYGNAFVYFFTSLFKVPDGGDVNPQDFCNLVGTFCGFVYLMVYIYYIYYKNNRKLLAFYIAGGIIIVSIVALLIMKYTVEDDNVSDQIFEWLGVIFNVCEYFPMGFNIIYLFRYRISEKYTLFGAFFGLLNTIMWLLWAIEAQRSGANLIHSIVANSIGICLQITQFVLFFLFRGDDPDDDKSVGEKPEDIDGLEEEKKKLPEYMQEFI